jgi:hypothetical protein
MTKYSVEGKALKIKLRKKERADPAAKEREAGIAGRRRAAEYLFLTSRFPFEYPVGLA